MRLKRLNSIFVLCILGRVALGQTNPTAQALPYSQDFSSFTGSTTAYPAGWQGWTIAGSLTTVASTATPSGNQALAGGTNATTTAGIYDMNGKMGILSTGAALKTACLAINTTGLTNINVSFLAQTQSQVSAGRIDELLLQYRVGTSGSFTSIAGSTYQNNATSTINTGTAGSNGATVAVMLPIACEGQAVVQLRWEIRDVSGSGNRPSFSIDDVAITMCITPTTQASNITFSSVYGTSMTVNWTNGNGGGRIVKINTSNSFTDPVNGTSQPANSVFGGSEQVVYNGTSNTVTVTGLTQNTTYWFRIYESNCTGVNSFFNVTTSANNPNSQITCNGCTSPSDYFRSFVTGSWSAIGSWESSPDNVTWYAASLIPTSAATSVTVLNGHTVTIDVNASSPVLTINNGGTLQANATTFVSLTLIGNLVNDGTVQMVNGIKGVDVVFNKNGSQSITGTGGTTNFYSIGLNMGASKSNYLTISSSNFSCTPTRALLFNSSGTNALQNGTIKFSGSYTFSGPVFSTGLSYAIAATAGIWLNNSNVTITASNDSYDVSGLLRITAGTLNVGTVVGNSIRLLSGSTMHVQGGTVNVAGRVQAANSAGTFQGTVTYNQSGGSVTLTTVGANTSGTVSDLDFHLFSDSLIMSGGTIIDRNVASTVSDVINYATCAITGGTIQFGDASTTVAAAGFEIECGGGSYMPSLVINNSSGLNPLLYPGTDIRVIGSITINAGTTLDNNWGSGFLYNFSLTGNWNNSGTFVHNNSRTVTFNGTSSQSITGTTATGFNNLTINNSLGGVTLFSPITISGTAGVLTLTNGYLYSSSTNTLTMNSGTSVSGVNNNSFVYGPMSKIGSSNFTFPVGKDVKYRPISATSLTGSETFTAEYFHADPDAVPYDVTLKDPTLDDIGRCEYWILNRVGTVNANVTLSWDTYSCGVTSLPDLAVARWDGSMWKDHGNGATTGTTASGTVISSAAVTSFSPFTLASYLSGANPLPIDLLSFTAHFNSSNFVDINWSTASETNNDYFTIERSMDGITFQEIGVVDGAGNSGSILNYVSIDDSPLSGISYYRLKQTDFNGDSKYSSIVSVQKNETSFEIINTSYFPSQNQLAVYFNCNSNCSINIEIYDLTGRRIYFSTKNTLGKNSEIIIPMNKIAEGVYLLKASDGEKLISKKIKI